MAAAEEEEAEEAEAGAEEAEEAEEAEVGWVVWDGYGYSCVCATAPRGWLARRRADRWDGQLDVHPHDMLSPHAMPCHAMPSQIMCVGWVWHVHGSVS